MVFLGLGHVFLISFGYLSHFQQIDTLIKHLHWHFSLDMMRGPVHTTDPVQGVLQSRVLILLVPDHGEQSCLFLVKGPQVSTHFITDCPQSGPPSFKLELHGNFLFEPVFDLFLHLTLIVKILLKLDIPSPCLLIDSLKSEHFILDELRFAPLFVCNVVLTRLHQRYFSFNLVDLLVQDLNVDLVFSCTPLTIHGLFEQPL